MAVYVDYDFYTTQFYGTAIAQADFSRLALRASAVIDQVTFGRTAAVITADEDDATIEKIKLATCAVAEEYQRLDKVGGGGEIQSERVGQHSVTYATGAATSDRAKLADAAKLYLWDTDLMYRGFTDDED